jgi:hypothetical protein
MVGGPKGLSYYSFRDLGDGMSYRIILSEISGMLSYRIIVSEIWGNVPQDYSFCVFGECPTGLFI